MTTQAPTGTTPPAVPPPAPANGAPPAAGAPETPPAPDAAKPPPPPEEGKTAAILRQRERALQQQRQEAQRERAETQRLQAQIAAEREAFRREQAEFRAEVDRTIAGIRGGKPPERPAQPAEPDPRDKAIQELKARLDEREKKEAARAFEETKERELSKFVTEARAGTDKWPLSSKFSETKLRTMAWNIAEQAAREGISLDNSEVLDRIEEELAEIAALKSESSKGTESAASKSVGAEHQSPETTKPAPTLTSARAGETAGETKPKKNGLKVSLDDTLAEVRAAREKLAAERASRR